MCFDYLLLAYISLTLGSSGLAFAADGDIDVISPLSLQESEELEIADLFLSTTVDAIQRQNQFYVKSLINGVDAGLILIDTGTQGTMNITKDLAKRLNLSSAGKIKVRGVGGEYEVEESRIHSLQIGDFVIRNIPVHVSPIKRRDGADVVGGIGREILKRVNLSFDYPGRKLSLYRLDRPDLMWKNINRDKVKGKAAFTYDSFLLVEASLDDNISFTGVLDSGAPTIAIDRGYFKEHIEPKMNMEQVGKAKILGADGREIEGDIYIAPPIKIGEASLRIRDLVVHDLPPDSKEKAIIGMNIFMEYKLHLDMKNKELILENP